MASDFRAGAASVNVSPEAPTLMICGGLHPTGPAKGVLEGHELYVDAIAMAAGDTALIIATCDAGGRSGPGEASVERVVAERTGCDPSCIRILSRHNHSSGASPADANDAACRRAVAAYQRKVYQGTIDACCRAYEAMKPAEIAAGTARLTETVGTNRRMRYAGGGVMPSWGSGPVAIPGEKFAGAADADPTRISFLVAREVGRTAPMALLTSYDSHIHLVSIDRFNSEAVGGVKNAFAELLPGAAIVYGNGFCGDVDMHGVHPIGAADDAGRVAWYRRSTALLGRRFAAAVVEAMPTEGFIRPESIQHLVYSTADSSHDRRQRNFTVRAFRLGSIAIATTPSEMFSAFAEQIHRVSPFRDLILLGFDGRCGYIGTPIAYEQGGYEIGLQGFSPEQETAMLAAGDRRRQIGLARPDTGAEITAQTLTLLKLLAAI
ncbi:MAG: hypothetical protein GX591_17755 [Planctomycetes bacterium]|nr:hypothetical protein [Planctomycetota bacterium]